MRPLVATGWAALVVWVLVVAAGRGDGGEPARRRSIKSAVRPSPGDLALTCDLLAVAVTAGLTPVLALRAALEAVPRSLVAGIAAVLADVDGGARLVVALERVATAEPTLRPLFDLLVTSECSGAPVGASLTRLGMAERSRGRQASLAHARKVPVRLLFPLVFLLLPAFLVLTVGPALIAGLG